MRFNRFPVCSWFSVLGALTYITFAILAYSRYPLPFSPDRNWLSDLGDMIQNPEGAGLYNLGVILTAGAQAAWFAGLCQWRLPRHTIQKRLLTVSVTSGLLCSAALAMSALNPINNLAVHSFWSRAHYILSGIAFGFSVAGLRYHRRMPVGVLLLGAIASAWPCTMFVLGGGRNYWMEWATVTTFILFILAVGLATFTLTRSHEAAPLNSLSAVSQHRSLS